MVEIRSIAREPGQRSKVAVAALQAGVDPVGACVGIRGVRIQAIVRELNDEKIDVIEWSADPAVYIAKALSPARVAGVYLNEQAKGAKTATVVVPEDQLSLAIGRDGQNARLAAKLTSWRIDIKSLPEAASDSLYKLQNDPLYATLAQNETDVVPQLEMILAKKAEGRPVTPEEYQVLAQFVDRVERGLIRQRQSEKKAEEERQRIARANVPAPAFEIPLEDFEVSDRVYAVVSEAGYQTVGDLMLQMKTDPDAILKLSGMGPKGMHELEEALEALTFPAEGVEAAPEAESPIGVFEVAEPVEVADETPEPEMEQPAAAVELEAQAEEPVAIAEPEAEPAASIVEAEAPVEETVSEAVPGEELVAEAPEGEVEAVQPEVEAVPSEAVPAPSEEEEVSSLDELFALRPEVLEIETVEEEDDDESSDRKKKKKKKKKFVEVEYDPDQDVMVVKKKRKRGGLEWSDEW
jgi:N utilization substance protein A